MSAFAAIMVADPEKCLTRGLTFFWQSFPALMGLEETHKGSRGLDLRNLDLQDLLMGMKIA